MPSEQSAETRAVQSARDDDSEAQSIAGRRFSQGTRPVIRWVKGDGRDDPITRAAIGQATRLFGDKVDYCLCTNGIGAARARWIMEWATQPVEWWPAAPQDNPALADALTAAGCAPARFGYWWKWFPERVRPEAAEWVLDGDMVIVAPPPWFAEWLAGRDPLRLTQDDSWPMDQMYGHYTGLVDPQLRLYSGLASLPPGLRYMGEVADILAAQPLVAPHDGVRDMCEQGVIAAAFQRLGARPIPLHEFPFARAFEPGLDFGKQGNTGRAWGFHFGNAFRRENPHFTTLSAAGVVLRLDRRPGPIARAAWLGALAQWGLPGWSTPGNMASLIARHAQHFAGFPVLDLGTSRGRLTSILASLGCRVTTLDKHDRGAAQNLAEAQVTVVQAEAAAWLSTCTATFALIIVDLHGNSPADWARLGPLLLPRLAPGGLLLVSNATLYRIPEWHAETGVQGFLDGLGPDWTWVVHETPAPGLAVIARAHEGPRADRRGDADLRLLVDGDEMWPSSRTGQRHVFRLMGPTGPLRLRSRSEVPKQAGQGSGDSRRLGVGVRRIAVEGPGFNLAILPGWQGFGPGFHSNEGALRWTNGEATIDLAMLARAHGPVTVTIDAYEQRDYPAPWPDPEPPG